MVYVIHALVPEWSDEMRGKKCKRKNMLGRSERKKKVALVSGKNVFICYIPYKPYLRVYLPPARLPGWDR